METSFRAFSKSKDAISHEVFFGYATKAESMSGIWSKKRANDTAEAIECLHKRISEGDIHDAWVKYPNDKSYYKTIWRAGTGYLLLDNETVTFKNHQDAARQIKMENLEEVPVEKIMETWDGFDVKQNDGSYRGELLAAYKNRKQKT